MTFVKVALLLVIFVDVMGQGLIFPIINTLIMDPKTPFLPSSTTASARSFDYGLIMAVFYIGWFLGAAYISKLSDMIGRKRAILICLAGAFLGYVLTILALVYSSFWLLVLGRAITGFTAGNQPIAQAALVDISRDVSDRARNMGLATAALSGGLIAGPIIGGVLSDHAIIGSLASLQLPFYVAAALIAATAVLIATAYSDADQPRKPFRFEPWEIFLILWRVRKRPDIMRISVIFFLFEFALLTFYIFMDAYLTERFGTGTFGTAMAMLTFGACVAVSGSVLVPFLGARMTFRSTVYVTQALIGLACLALIVTPGGVVSYLPIALIGFAFGVGYPALLSMYSLSAAEDEQGWVMGVNIALSTLGSAMTSLIGGEAMAIEVRLPFLYAAGVSLLSLLLIGLLWRMPKVRRIAALRPAAAQEPAEAGSG